MIKLVEMSEQLVRQFFNGFENDPAVYEDVGLFHTYIYSDAAADTYWEHQKRLGRIHLAVMHDQEPIGEIILKNVDINKKCCTLSIHLKNDSVKNKGYGTRAEILVLEYVFDLLQMETVYADAILKNKRSLHVLEKVGFMKYNQDESYCYYRCDKSSWLRSKILDAGLVDP